MGERRGGVEKRGSNIEKKIFVWISSRIHGTKTNLRMENTMNIKDRHIDEFSFHSQSFFLFPSLVGDSVSDLDRLKVR